MSSVSVIMVTYHTGPALWLAIDSVLAQPECKELILVDNGNVPGVLKRLEMLAQQETGVVLLTGHGNVGFAKGCNLGAAKAAGDYILLLNPDSMLPSAGLTRAIAVMQTFPQETLAGCYLVNPDGSEQRGGRRALLTIQNAVVESLGLHKFFKRFERLNFNLTPMPQAAHKVPAISGAFMLLSRAFYNRLGGLDESYFLHMEDMDLCYRVTQAGGTIICMPEVRVLHFRSTSEVPSAFVEKHKARGFIRYLKTHFADQHSPLFFTMMTAGIWLRYRLKRIVGRIDRIFVLPLAGKQEIARLVLLYKFSQEKTDASLSGKTILVTGASGQIGLCIVGKALARGASVIALYNKTKLDFTHPNLKWLHYDLTDPENSLQNIKADLLLHTAALWLLPAALPKFLEAGIQRVIAFGSTSVVGKINSKNKYEKGIVKKLANAEKEIERICAEQSRAFTILRPTMIYGAGLDANVTRLANVIERFGFLPVYMPAKGLRHPMQALDLADTALAIADNAQTFGRSYNLGSKEAITYRTMLEELFKYLGKKTRMIHMPFMPLILDALGMLYQFKNINGEMAHRMNRDLLFDIQPAIDDFGFAPHAFLEGDIVL